MKWESYLDERIHHNLYINALVYMPMIKIVRRIARPGDLILEAGCGSGRTAILMADMGYKIVALDKSFILLDRISSVTAFLQDMYPISSNIAHIPFKDKIFRLAYSCEVLEHFDPPEIISFLKEQKRVSHYVLVDVPNDRCTKQSFGDERFYSEEKWAEIINAAGLDIIKVIYRGMDRGKYVGNCSVFLTRDHKEKGDIQEEIDVYDYY